MTWSQLREREMIVPLRNPLSDTVMPVAAPGFPVKFSATPASYDSPAPLPGMHTAEVLSRLVGLSTDAIERLKAGGVI
jgi:formyl-CoA transferase